MNHRTRTKVWLLRASVAGAATLCGTAVVAQTAAAAAVAPAVGSTEAAASPLSLRQAFDAAWSRQPEALALQLKSGDARVLSDESLVDRVLGKALSSMENA